ncbi:MAG TPA: manganese ABC transporter ATP-binding protein [Cytophagales bacterium]|jgi:manganese/zinc/iron transport system ATP- binding protein|nr:manganese ABC transporter ATP-binding protein [Cytophagales bacterium]
MIKEAKNPVLEIHDLTVTYHKKPVLWDIDLTIPAGSLTGIIGPNGAGKSTLIKTIMGLIKPSSGYSKIFDKPLDEVRKRVSYVPQRGSVDWDFPASVFDVVLMGRYSDAGMFKRIRKADRELAMDALQKVGMEKFSKRQISELSGGQQQRVFLARALAQHADLYFMDEPFAGVDAATENAIIDLLHEMTGKGKTVVVVHHDLQSAIKYFEWILLLNTRLVASGPVTEVFTSELLQKTYGGKLTLLTEIGNLLQREGLPARETK